MYIPAPFRETNLERLDFLAAQNSFGTLVSTTAAGPFATHLPVLYQREGKAVSLKGHWARANCQWQGIDSQRVLFILHGPHAYISPRWYAEPARNVPTWNYVAAHLYGRVRLIEDARDLAELVGALAAFYEADASTPWRLEDSKDSRALLGAIVGFELAVDEIQLKFKLNQNHPAVNVCGAISALRAKSGENSAAIAELMQQELARRA